MANARTEVLRSIKRAGIGVFVNSLSHLDVALDIGIQPGDIVFAGSGHSSGLLERISSFGINYHADSLNQLDEYLSFHPIGNIGLRINVGSLLKDTKRDPAPRLGMSLEEFNRALCKYPDQVSTLHVYVGTNLLHSEMHCDCLTALVELSKKYDSITDIDLGGGFAFAPGDCHDHDIWSEVFRTWKLLSKDANGLQLIIEPGRSIVKTAGKFFVTVTDIKKQNGNVYAVVNTSGTWFPRKIIHDANDDMVSVIGKNNDVQGRIKTHICGCTTYSKDFLSVTDLPELTVGDVICFLAAGAYNEAMHMDFQCPLQALL